MTYPVNVVVDDYPVEHLETPEKDGGAGVMDPPPTPIKPTRQQATLGEDVKFEVPSDVELELPSPEPCCPATLPPMRLAPVPRCATSAPGSSAAQHTQRARVVAGKAAG